VVEVTDVELMKAGVHLSMIQGVLDGAIGLLERLHIVAACAEIYKAYPEIRGDIEELIKDVCVLIERIRALTV
jgi:hypothetical protein